MKQQQKDGEKLAITIIAAAEHFYEKIGKYVEGSVQKFSPKFLTLGAIWSNSICRYTCYMPSNAKTLV